MQEFEKYPDLSFHIERMACTGIGSGPDWQAFTDALNNALRDARTDGAMTILREQQSDRKELLRLDIFSEEASAKERKELEAIEIVLQLLANKQ